MTPEFVIQVAREAMLTSLYVAGAPMLVALIVGLVVSVFQAVTQISEITLVFIPKIVAVFISLIVAGPFMLDALTKFTINIFTGIPDLAK